MTLNYQQRLLMTLLVKLNVTHFYKEYHLSQEDFLLAMRVMGPEETLEIEDVGTGLDDTQSASHPVSAAMWSIPFAMT